MPVEEWTGFHRIEQALWVEQTTEGHGADSPTNSWST